MREKKTNSGKLKSMEKISDALLALMRNRPFAEISVTDICDAAGLVRKTYYRNFRSKTAVIEFKFDRLREGLISVVDIGKAGAKGVLEYCFDYIDKHEELNVVLLDRTLADVVAAKVIEFIDIALNSAANSAVAFAPSLVRYYNIFLIEGVVSVVRSWIAEGRKESAATMASLVARLISGVTA